MRQLSILFVFILLLKMEAVGQATEKSIETLNQAIDQAVVDGDFDFLNRHYADDFVFTHGTGVIDSKESWLKDIKGSTDRFKSRTHDSTTVEMHGDVAIILGRLEVHKAKGDRYSLRYIRVYALRKHVWQLLSHRTLKEDHF